MPNIIEAASMTLKNGMTLLFKDSRARVLIEKLKDLVDTKYGPDNPPPSVEGGTIWYATCTTGSGTAAKVATSATGDFSLATGSMVRILFSDTNIQTEPTLSVDGSTAKRIKNLSNENTIVTNLWRAGEVVDLVYNGTDFVVSSGGLANGTYYGKTKLSNSTSSSSQTTAASSKAVKDTYDAIPSASSATPQDLGTAAAGSSSDYSRADHVHNLPTIPSASSATPQDLGTAAAGSSSDYSRADHVHKMPSASDVGLGNVDNVQQYSASNPPPYPVTSVNGNTGAVTIPKALYFQNEVVSAGVGDICTISDASITADYVVASLVFTDSVYITTPVTWSTSAGSLVLNGTCTAATTVSVVLVPKDN